MKRIRKSGKSIARVTNHEFTHVAIDDREYSKEEIIEILKKHKAEEDAKYYHCDRCGKKYLENNKHDLVTNNLNEAPPEGVHGASYAIGYSATPYIKGFQILSTCGTGRSIKLCDECVGKLIEWIKVKDSSLSNNPSRGHVEGTNPGGHVDIIPLSNGRYKFVKH